MVFGFILKNLFYFKYPADMAVVQGVFAIKELLFNLYVYKGKLRTMFIAIDFDGTCVTHEFPHIGKDIGAVPVLRELAEKHKLILYTIRSGDTLEQAKKWFEDNGIPLFGVNTNPIQWKFSKSKKLYANLYIDDSAIGCPLVHDEEMSNKPFADWVKIRELLEAQDII